LFPGDIQFLSGIDNTRKNDYILEIWGLGFSELFQSLPVISFTNGILLASVRLLLYFIVKLTVDYYPIIIFMTNCDLLINNCFVLQPDFTFLENASIVITKNHIAAIGPADKISRQYQPANSVDGSGKIAMPGFVDAHTHTAQQLLRGRTVDEPPMIWTRILVPYESHLTPEDVHISALLCCVEMIKAGITAFADAGGPHMSMTAEAAMKAGLRAAITTSNMDRGDFIPPQMKRPTAEVIHNNEELYKKYDDAAGGRIRIFFGLRQVMTSTPELIEQVAGAACQHQTGIHIHLAEHINEIDFCLVNYHMRPAEYLDHCGLLNNKVLAAHSILLSDKEVLMLNEKKVKVVHCPRANLANHGFAKTPLMCALGISVGLGTDGVSGHGVDHFTEMMLLKHALHADQGIPIRQPAVLTSRQVYRMATQGGADAMQIGEDVGTLEVGKKADLILLNLNQPHLLPTHNLIQTVLTSASARDVTDVIVDGQLLMQDRQLLTLDEEQIHAKASEHLKAIAVRAELG
jgi:5-methylthioadenosine/S-adenosylhomocysteine deaminase